MAFKNSDIRYGSWVIGLHWLMLVLLATVYACMELRGLAPKGGELRASLKPLHFLLGLSVLALVAVRLAVRWGAGAAPDIRPPAPIWQERLARLMHLALYAFMIATPDPGLADAERRRPSDRPVRPACAVAPRRGQDAVRAVAGRA